MKILKKGGGSREKGEEETKSMPHATVIICTDFYTETLTVKVRKLRIATTIKL